MPGKNGFMVLKLTQDNEAIIELQGGGEVLLRAPMEYDHVRVCIRTSSRTHRIYRRPRVHAPEVARA